MSTYRNFSLKKGLVTGSAKGKLDDQYTEKLEIAKNAYIKTNNALATRPGLKNIVSRQPGTFVDIEAKDDKLYILSKEVHYDEDSNNQLNSSILDFLNGLRLYTDDDTNPYVITRSGIEVNGDIFDLGMDVLSNPVIKTRLVGANIREEGSENYDTVNDESYLLVTFQPNINLENLRVTRNGGTEQVHRADGLGNSRIRDVSQFLMLFDHLDPVSNGIFNYATDEPFNPDVDLTSTSYLPIMSAENTPYGIQSAYCNQAGDLSYTFIFKNPYETYDLVYAGVSGLPKIDLEFSINENNIRDNFIKSLTKESSVVLDREGARVTESSLSIYFYLQDFFAGLGEFPVFNAHSTENIELPDRFEGRQNGVGISLFGLDYTLDDNLVCDQTDSIYLNPSVISERTMQRMTRKNIDKSVNNLPVLVAEFPTYFTDEFQNVVLSTPSLTEEEWDSNIQRFLNQQYSGFNATTLSALGGSNINGVPTVYDRRVNIQNITSAAFAQATYLAYLLGGESCDISTVMHFKEHRIGEGAGVEVSTSDQTTDIDCTDKFTLTQTNDVNTEQDYGAISDLIFYKGGDIFQYRLKQSSMVAGGLNLPTSTVDPPDVQGDVLQEGSGRDTVTQTIVGGFGVIVSDENIEAVTGVFQTTRNDIPDRSGAEFSFTSPTNEKAVIAFHSGAGQAYVVITGSRALDYFPDTITINGEVFSPASATLDTDNSIWSTTDGQEDATFLRYTGGITITAGTTITELSSQGGQVSFSLLAPTNVGDILLGDASITAINTPSDEAAPSIYQLAVGETNIGFLCGVGCGTDNVMDIMFSAGDERDINNMPAIDNSEFNLQFLRNGTEEVPGFLIINDSLRGVTLVAQNANQDDPEAFPTSFDITYTPTGGTEKTANFTGRENVNAYTADFGDGSGSGNHGGEEYGTTSDISDLTDELEITVSNVQYDISHSNFPSNITLVTPTAASTQTVETPHRAIELSRGGSDIDIGYLKLVDSTWSLLTDEDIPQADFPQTITLSPTDDSGDVVLTKTGNVVEESANVSSVGVSPTSVAGSTNDRIFLTNADAEWVQGISDTIDIDSPNLAATRNGTAIDAFIRQNGANIDVAFPVPHTTSLAQFPDTITFVTDDSRTFTITKGTDVNQVGLFANGSQIQYFGPRYTGSLPALTDNVVSITAAGGTGGFAYSIPSDAIAITTVETSGFQYTHTGNYDDGKIYEISATEGTGSSPLLIAGHGPATAPTSVTYTKQQIIDSYERVREGDEGYILTSQSDAVDPTQIQGTLLHISSNIDGNADIRSFEEYTRINPELATIKDYLQVAVSITKQRSGATTYPQYSHIAEVVPDIKVVLPGTDVSAEGTHLFTTGEGDHVFVGPSAPIWYRPFKQDADQAAYDNTDDKLTSNASDTDAPYLEDADGFDVGTGFSASGIGVTLYIQRGNAIAENGEPIFIPVPINNIDINAGGVSSPAAVSFAVTTKVIHLTLDYGNQETIDYLNDMKYLSFYGSNGKDSANILSMVKVADGIALNDYSEQLSNRFNYKSIYSSATVDSPGPTTTLHNIINMESLPINLDQVSAVYATNQRIELREENFPRSYNVNDTSTNEDIGAKSPRLRNNDNAIVRSLNSIELNKYLFPLIPVDTSESIATANNLRSAIQSLEGIQRRLTAKEDIVGLLTRARFRTAGVDRILEFTPSTPRRIINAGIFTSTIGRRFETDSRITQNNYNNLESVEDIRNRQLNVNSLRYSDDMGGTRLLNGVIDMNYDIVSVFREPNLSIEYTDTNRNVSYTLTRANIGTVLAEYRDLLRETETDTYQKIMDTYLNPFSTEFVAYNEPDDHNIRLDNRTSQSADGIVHISSKRPGEEHVFSLGWKEYFRDILTVNTSLAFLRRSRIPVSTGILNPSEIDGNDPQSFSVEGKPGQDLELKDNSIVSEHNLLSTNIGIFNIQESGSVPILNRLSNQGFSTNVIEDSSTLIGGDGKQIKMLRYLEKYRGFVNAVVTKDFELDSDIISVAGLIERHKLVFFHTKDEHNKIYVLSLGEQDQLIKGFTVFELPIVDDQSIQKIFAISEDKLGVIINFDLFELDFANKTDLTDYSNIIDDFENYEYVIQPLPIIQLDGRNISTNKRPSVSKLSLGIDGHAQFDVQVVNADTGETKTKSIRKTDPSNIAEVLQHSGQFLVESMPSNGCARPAIRITKDDGNYIEISSIIAIGSF